MDIGQQMLIKLLQKAKFTNSGGIHALFEGYLNQETS